MGADNLGKTQRKNANRAARKKAERLAGQQQRTVIVWLRDDMRLNDNRALAVPGKIVPVYIHDTVPCPWPLRGAGLAYKHWSLQHFEQTLAGLGSRLNYRVGNALEELLQVAIETQATVVCWNRRYEPWYLGCDEAIEEGLRLNGIEVQTFDGNVLYEPWVADPITRAKGWGFGSVQWWRVATKDLDDPVVAPKITALAKPECWPESLPLEALGYGETNGKGMPSDFKQYNMNSKGDWAQEMRKFWTVGEEAAMKRLRVFLNEVLAEGIFEKRDRFRADRKWTAILSPYIRFGELSVRTCMQMSQEIYGKIKTEKGWREVSATFQRRFMWRDLAYFSLWRWDYMPTYSLREQYEREAWDGTKDQLRAWQQGRTGYPLVDAAMRQLWKIGWMPNYLRHVVAQFLIEYLDISWKEGFKWFDYTLVDTDVAINAHMWQNGGHSGLDQWNFVMHPVNAAKSCDPEGDYVRRWLPELRGLPKEYIHCPWQAPVGILISAGANPLSRILDDPDRARIRHTKNVIAVRNHTRANQPWLMDAKTGNEILDLGDHKVKLITRQDLRKDTEEFLTFQTADEARDPRKRVIRTHQAMLMNDIVREWERGQSDHINDIL